MKYLKMAFGLVVVASLMAVVASPAMAVPRWVHCVKSATGKYSNGLCNASGTGWETKELTETSEVTSSGELELEDTKATGGAVAVKCTGNNTGWVSNPKATNESGEDGVATITNVKCVFVKEGLCRKIISVEARNLPWGTRLEESGTEVRDEIITGSASGEPGWKVSCENILGGTTEDTCVRSGNTVNAIAIRATGKLESVFDAITAKSKAKCTIGGSAAGNVSGTVLSLLRSGNALWILAPNLGT